MKEYYVLIPDQDEFQIVKDILTRRLEEALDIIIVENYHQINEPHSRVRREISVQTIFAKDVYRVHFIQSGVGKVATCKTMHKLLRVLDDPEYGGHPECIILAGSACGTTPGIYNIARSYQEIDLTPAGRSMGESPDLPIRYETKRVVSRFSDLPMADSLNVERFCLEFPRTSDYIGISDKVIIDMEDYAFSSMIDDSDTEYYIIRGVTDNGNFSSWRIALKACITEILEILFTEFDKR